MYGCEDWDTALFDEAVNRKSAQRWRRPAQILDIDETGVTVTFQDHSIKLGRYCVRKKVEEKDVEVRA